MMDKPVTIKDLLLYGTLLLGGNGAVSAFDYLSVDSRLSNENQGFTRVQERVLWDVCGFPGPIRDPDDERPRPRPR